MTIEASVSQLREYLEILSALAKNLEKFELDFDFEFDSDVKRQILDYMRDLAWKMQDNIQKIYHYTVKLEIHLDI